LATYLAFEEPLKELENSIESAKLRGDENAIAKLSLQLRKRGAKKLLLFKCFSKASISKTPR